MVTLSAVSLPLSDLRSPIPLKRLEAIVFAYSLLSTKDSLDFVFRKAVAIGMEQDPNHCWQLEVFIRQVPTGEIEMLCACGCSKGCPIIAFSASCPSSEDLAPPCKALWINILGQ